MKLFFQKPGNQKTQGGKSHYIAHHGIEDNPNKNPIDTGKVTVCLYSKQENIVVVDMYTNEALSDADLEDIQQVFVKIGASIPVNAIYVKSGQNVLSEKAFRYTLGNNDVHKKVVFVIKHMADLCLPVKASKTYFKGAAFDYCATIDEAYRLIKK